jgi:hypothetical protein
MRGKRDTGARREGGEGEYLGILKIDKREGRGRGREREREGE